MLCLWEERRGQLVLEAAQTAPLPLVTSILCCLTAGRGWHISFDYRLPSHRVENWNSQSRGPAITWGAREQLCVQ